MKQRHRVDWAFVGVYGSVGLMALTVGVFVDGGAWLIPFVSIPSGAIVLYVLTADRRRLRD